MSRPVAHQDDGLAGLRDARETDRLSIYLHQLWQRRTYAWYVAKSEMRSRQINSVLGNLWHLINPMLQVGIFFLMFAVILDVRRGVDNFIGFLSVGIFTYGFTQRSVLAGGRSLTKYLGLIRFIAFPRALLPITTTITETLASIPAYGFMLVVALLTGEPPRLAWLLVIPVMAIQALFNLGLALVTARAVHAVLDVQQILPFVFRLGFYASGVLFNVNAYMEGRSYGWVFKLNPMYCFIEINRGLILSGFRVDGDLVVIALLWTVVALVGGLLWFRAGEDSYGNE